MLHISSFLAASYGRRQWLAVQSCCSEIFTLFHMYMLQPSQCRLLAMNCHTEAKWDLPSDKIESQRKTNSFKQPSATSYKNDSTNTLLSDYVFTTTVDKLSTSKGPSKDNTPYWKQYTFKGCYSLRSTLKQKLLLSRFSFQKLLLSAELFPLTQPVNFYYEDEQIQHTFLKTVALCSAPEEQNFENLELPSQNHH